MTRREFIKKTAIGTSLLFMGAGTGFAQSRHRDGAVPIHPNNPAISRNDNRCRDCGRCRSFCGNTKGVFGRAVPLGEDACTYCGQCTFVCSRRNITERYHYREVNSFISSADRVVVATTAPAIRVALGEMFRQNPGTDVEGRIVGALRHIGVDHVLDATFAADLTVMEEASELIHRITHGGVLPMFTSCSPAWIKFVETFYPEFIPNLST